MLGLVNWKSHLAASLLKCRPTQSCRLAHVLKVLECGVAHEVQVQERTASILSILAVSQYEFCAGVDLIDSHSILAFQFQNGGRFIGGQDCVNFRVSLPGLLNVNFFTLVEKFSKLFHSL